MTSVRFFEGLYDHDEIVSPAIAQLRREVAAGDEDLERIEEDLRLLLERLLERHLELRRQVDSLPAARASTRRELFRRLKRAKDFIDSSLGERIDLAQISRVACLSPHHFLRSFKAVFGATPHQYLTQVRIDRAEDLLHRTDLSVTEICFAVGFESLGSFSSLLRRCVGASPSEFRQRPRSRA